MGELPKHKVSRGQEGGKGVFSPTGSPRPGNDGLSPMNGPQPLVPSYSTGSKHQGTTGHGPRPTTATVGRTPWLAKPPVHAASGPTAAAQMLLLIFIVLFILFLILIFLVILLQDLSWPFSRRS